MDIDIEGFEHGLPSWPEMVAHQVVLLTHEAEQAWGQVAKAKADVRKLVDINADLNKQIMALQRQVLELRHHLCMETNMHGRIFSTWGGASPGLKSKQIAVYPIL
ncbi:MULTISPECIES: hypothetical protein [unclassified Pseudomonas]|uniref:hypothetical protein n=1 Tax=unclassified Pseudomonas TaxID=196821 RepID=UPI001E5EA656|nr:MULTISPECIES: hypothetical protein [unclassified Pseudomonas]MDH1696926.1 hypothetical protein [Pseudomonas sp. GD03766]UFH27332.1 hypothetical protein LMH93_01540 [Pseudomonas sp. CIP-10]